MDDIKKQVLKELLEQMRLAEQAGYEEVDPSVAVAEAGEACCEGESLSDELVNDATEEGMDEEGIAEDVQEDVEDLKEEHPSISAIRIAILGNPELSNQRKMLRKPKVQPKTKRKKKLKKKLIEELLKE